MIKTETETDPERAIRKTKIVRHLLNTFLNRNQFKTLNFLKNFQGNFQVRHPFTAYGTAKGSYMYLSKLININSQLFAEGSVIIGEYSLSLRRIIILV